MIKHWKAVCRFFNVECLAIGLFLWLLAYTLVILYVGTR